MAQERPRVVAGPPALPHRLTGLHQASTRHEHQGHGGVGDGLGQHARGVGHADPPAAGGGQVHPVDPDPRHGDHAQPVGPAQGLGVHRVTGLGQDGVHVRERRPQDRGVGLDPVRDHG